MAMKRVIFAMTMAAAMPAAATQPDPGPVAMAPAGSPTTEYCLRVGPVTGRLVETVECWTREMWAEQGVDVDKEWARDGVRVVG